MTQTHARPRILVVDDTPDNLFLMGALLEGEYDVVTADCGPRALAIAAGPSPPELILLDVMMPDMDGHMVLRRLKQQITTAGIPVVFLTARVSPAEERMGLELGAIDYFAKPINPALLLARVDAILSRKREPAPAAPQSHPRVATFQ